MGRGELDITEFAPKSVKSEGDFEDILAADNPDVWESHRPAEGGEAGAMLKKIIERAAALKAGKATPRRLSDGAKRRRQGRKAAAPRQRQARREPEGTADRNSGEVERPRRACKLQAPSVAESKA